LGEGFYHLSIPDSGQGVQLDTASARLMRLPQVKVASRLARMTGQWTKPRDGLTWRQWSLSPDTIGSENNWALEQINAPFGWGCSTGSATTRIAVIDHPFDNNEAISNSLAPLPLVLSKRASLASAVATLADFAKRGGTRRVAFRVQTEYRVVSAADRDGRARAGCRSSNLWKM
jgi:hypothetical protein